MSLLLLGMLPLTSVAQDDDMYFVPTKENEAKEARSYGMPSNTYYSGSTRSVDEYNRHLGSSVMPIDSLGNDIIDFSAERGVYPDSTYQEGSSNDYQYTRRLSRFDDYTPSDIYWEGYRDGQWSSPWYYNSWYAWYDYDPWYWNHPYYYGWYSPWHYGYYRPWRYGWYGYRGRYWYGGRRYYASRPIRRTTYSAGRTFGGRTTATGRTFGERTTATGRTFGSRSSSYNSTFGTSRSSGSFGGRSSGGSFGGGRSASGGRSFGGRR